MTLLDFIAAVLGWPVSCAAIFGLWLFWAILRVAPALFDLIDPGWRDDVVE